ncbi:MAG: argininosuccinate lyase [Firmicutes bacterium]|nr:argininosuccinate lyase [Bacillota bacterium]
MTTSGPPAPEDLWGGRFHKELDPQARDFHSSVRFDWRLFPYDIRGSMAHARMLGRCGIIPQEDADRICEGLESILSDLSTGRLAVDPRAEDIHSFVEAELTRRIGDAGKRLHTARSRNDQVAVDTRMYVRDAIDGLAGRLHDGQQALVDLAGRYLDVIMPGYTHLQRAQPVLFAHHCLAYFEMFFRDRERLADCRRRADVCPLGAGALAGVPYPVDREGVARELGFAAVAANSLDAVSDRDYVIELVSALALIMVHLSRLGEELVLWASQEFGFVEVDDAFATGSSIMPQKKNPDMAELVRGKAGRVFGHLQALLAMMKGLPLAYNKDMQEDKEALFDAVDTAAACLGVMVPMLRSLRVRGDRTLAATRQGFLNATDLADYLVQRGVPFREAHRLVGQAVARCLETGRALEDLSLEELRALSPVIEEDVYAVLDIRRCVDARNSRGGTARAQVEQALAEARRRLAGRKPPQQPGEPALG